jgi:hypothetical protein
VSIRPGAAFANCATMNTKMSTSRYAMTNIFRVESNSCKPLRRQMIISSRSWPAWRWVGGHSEGPVGWYGQNIRTNAAGTIRSIVSNPAHPARTRTLEVGLQKKIRV